MYIQMFFSTHYAGMPLMVEFREGEPWKKVFGPVFMYLNSASADEDPLTLWSDANEQVCWFHDHNLLSFNLFHVF